MPMSAGHPALPDFTPLFQDDGRALRANTTECMCTATGCTFNNCGGSSARGTWTINGTIMVSGDTYTFDLDYHIVTSGVDYAWTIDGSLTLTATSIDGSMTSKGHGTVNTMGYNFSYDYDVSTDFNMVVLDGQSCPTGGSIHSEVSYSTSGVQGGEAGNYHVQGTVTFGPTCGAAM